MYSTIDMVINALLSIMGGGALGFGVACLLLAIKDNKGGE